MFVDWDQSDHMCLVCLLSACDLQAHRDPQTFLKVVSIGLWRPVSVTAIQLCHHGVKTAMAAM